MRDDLGDWIKCRLRCGVHEQGNAAREQIDRCGYDVKELVTQWTLQKKSQLSLRAHAPARLKKELDTVISLQADLDTTNRALQTARSAIKKEAATSETLSVLDSLERTHEQLMTKVDALYASLNVQDKFPELDGVRFDFIQILLLAHDLKINVQKCAIGSFFEWDKLDRAVSGGQKPLGTKLHQHTHKAIAKCQPALMSAICKFNAYCKQLEELYDPAWCIPLPTPLPTKLADLRTEQSLMEDIWVMPASGEVPLWMEDQDV
ncbi:hypothetical protein PAXINDRAFT_6532 [Paxillus involutus ATCC 200175]|nr:hypothetical protein PAXINDRAFT_6532 [Paxillus involutus ATCC 200175]